jgi:HD-GYP domain-containing protein (c-di-GMP phosphodiesterase class II)
MTSDRPYRSALSTDEAVAEIIAGSGTQFDPRCVEAFEVLAAEDDGFVLRDRRLTPIPTFAAS